MAFCLLSLRGKRVAEPRYHGDLVRNAGFFAAMEPYITGFDVYPRTTSGFSFLNSS